MLNPVVQKVNEKKLRKPKQQIKVRVLRFTFEHKKKVDSSSSRSIKYSYEEGETFLCPQLYNLISKLFLNITCNICSTCLINLHLTKFSLYLLQRLSSIGGGGGVCVPWGGGL